MLSRALPARVRTREAAAAEVLRLLELASQIGPEELRRASVRHAVELAKGFRIRIPRIRGLVFCRRCLAPYSFSAGSRVRVRRGRAGRTVVITCGNCGAVRRIPV